MNPLYFLLIAAVIGVVGTVAVMAGHRRPSRPEAAMDEFRREMQALAPRDGVERQPRDPGPRIQQRRAVPDSDEG